MVILLVGADNREGYYYGLADSIRAVRVDFVQPRLTVLAFPRDLWVAIPGLEERGVTHGKLNQAYFYGNLYHQPGSGPSLLAQTLYVNFGLRVDRYVAINESVFVSAIDRLGGIDLYLPGRANGTWVGLPYSPSGWYHFTGKKALEFASIRMPDSDWQRIDRQNQVLLAMAERATQPQMLPQLLGIVFSLLDETLTDLSKAEISRLFCLLPMIERQDVFMTKITPDMVTARINERGMYVMIPHEEVRALVADFMAGALGQAGP
jgi:LCP family protein required for cell wall assembly